jgi:hypothetical protein
MAVNTYLRCVNIEVQAVFVALDHGRPPVYVPLRTDVVGFCGILDSLPGLYRNGRLKIQ